MSAIARLTLILLIGISFGQTRSQREQGYLPPQTSNAVSLPLALVSQSSVLAPSRQDPRVSPLEMKLLILSPDGTEPGLAALRNFLDYQATPYEVVRLGLGEKLPKLNNETMGFYHGVILTTGNLGICDPTCHSALSAEGWTTLETYARDFQVRIASYYTFPEARFGMTFRNSRGTSVDLPIQTKLTTAGAEVFPYLQPDATISVVNAFAYFGTPAPAKGEETIPLLTSTEGTIAAIHKKTDGREYLAFSVDNNANLMHSQAFTYGMIRWVTRGIFLGFRKAFLNPQVDDVFLPSVLFNGSKEKCRPGSPAFDPLNPTVSTCSIVRIGGSDLDALQRWQQKWRENSQFASFKTTLAFNGFGSKAEQDSLRDRAVESANDFFWVSHTYDHRNLDCFAAGPEGCRPAGLDESVTEIADNFAFSKRVGLPSDPLSMVTPMITGLTNKNFLKAATQSGIRYLIADGSRPEGMPLFPNTPISSISEPNVLLISRRPTNIFFESAEADLGRDGSEPDEFNFLYGPSGLFRIGGPGGKPFFPVNQTYEQILARESDLFTGYFFRGDMSPLMFHQSNLFRHTADRSLFSDVFDATFRKWKSISNLPLISLTQSALGELLEQRQGYLAAKVRGIWVPGVGVKLKGSGSAMVPVTGMCPDSKCEEYGPDKITYVKLDAGKVATVEF